MRKIALFIIIIVSYSSLQAQINIGSTKFAKWSSTGEIDPIYIELLKTTETVFLYRQNEEFMIEKYKTEFAKVWNITNIIFAPYSKFELYKNNLKYSFFSIGLLAYTVQNEKGQHTGDVKHPFLHLWMNINGKEQNFCRIELNPSMDFYKPLNTSIIYLYSSKAEIFNWKYGYLKNYLQLVNNYLLHGKLRNLFEENLSMKFYELESDTLYISKQSLMIYPLSIFKLNENYSSDYNKFYEFPQKVILDEELNHLICDTTRQIYYLLYVMSGSDKFITITNSATGEIIYANYSKGINIKEKDFKRINKYLKRSIRQRKSFLMPKELRITQTTS